MCVCVCIVRTVEWGYQKETTEYIVVRFIQLLKIDNMKSIAIDDDDDQEHIYVQHDHVSLM